MSIFQNLHSKITNNMPRTPHSVKSLNTVYPNVYFNSYKCIFFISFFEYCLIEEYIKYRVTIRKWHSLIMRNQRKYCHVSQYVSSFRFQCSIKTRFLIKHYIFSSDSLSVKRLQIRVVKYSSIHSSMTRMIYGLGASGVLNKLNKI